MYFHIYQLFYFTFNCIGYVVSKSRMIDCKWGIGNDLEGSGRGLLKDSVLTFAWIDWWKSQEISVRGVSSRLRFEPRILWIETGVDDLTMKYGRKEWAEVVCAVGRVCVVTIK
jgi:hypothetical protein